MLNDEVLGALIDGELAPERRDAVERALGDNRGAALRLENLRRGDEMCRDAFALTDSAKDPLAELIAHGWPKRVSRPVVWGRRAAAIAAACLLGVFAGRLSGPVAPDSQLRASSEIARVLDQAPSGALSPIRGGQVQVALSLRADNGALCRQYRTIIAGEAVDALACKQGDAWRLAVQAAVISPGNYRTAAASDPVAAAIDGLSGASVLSADEENQFIANGWSIAP
jgi:hypothetical protein